MARTTKIRRDRARTLRRDGTDAEMRLWSRLRNRQLGGFKFVRQEPIGPYFADFACRECNLIVELDGGQHAESERDTVRDAHLGANGYRVLRFWNTDIMGNIEGVLEILLSELRKSPHPDR